MLNDLAEAMALDEKKTIFGVGGIQQAHSVGEWKRILDFC